MRIGMTRGDAVVPRGDERASHALRRRLGADVLLTAGTGRARFAASSEGLLVDPGSITGARTSALADGRPSYTLMILDAGKVCARPGCARQCAASDDREHANPQTFSLQQLEVVVMYSKQEAEQALL
jgi:hypothetical protein